MVSILVSGAVILIRVGTAPMLANAQQPTAAAPLLVFDGVTVVDVEQGKLVPDQRVVIAGNRIRDVGRAGAVKMPEGAQVVTANGKYLIPGLWDLHVHPQEDIGFFFPYWIANGVTGIRDAWSRVPLEEQRARQREILAGTRVGPPRQILSGAPINISCEEAEGDTRKNCLDANVRAMRGLVDSLKAAGADIIKARDVPREVYLAIAAEARRIGIPVGGHLAHITASEASDSGARLVDHLGEAPSLVDDCWGFDATVARCQPVADRFKRNGTWVVPTLVYDFGMGREKPAMEIIKRVGLPLVAGTDVQISSKFLPQTEIKIYMTEGLTPLEALQTATLNPAKMWHATDSLGTVAVGKLADLVLLDADPLADVANTTKIRAVVANGRYFDRAALDQLLAQASAALPKPEPAP